MFRIIGQESVNVDREYIYLPINNIKIESKQGYTFLFSRQ